MAHLASVMASSQSRTFWKIQGAGDNRLKYSYHIKRVLTTALSSIAWAGPPPGIIDTGETGTPLGTCRPVGLPQTLFGAAHQLDARFGAFHQATIGGEIIERHAARGEASFEDLANPGAVELRQTVNVGYSADLVFHDKAGKPVVDDFRDRAAVKGDDGRPAGHGLDHDQTKRLRPVDRDQQSDSSAQEVRFLVVADFADKVDQRILLDHGPDQFVII